MKLSKSAIAVVAASFVSANVTAASLDFRHEYRGKTDQHSSRVKMGNTFENNLSIDLELKFKGADGEFMKDLQNNGSEIGINYKWAINSEWALQPGMPIEFGASSDTYKPQLRVTYTPDAVDDLSLSARYRLDVKPGEDEKKFRNRYTFNAGYKIENLSLGIELNYYKSHDSDYLLYDGKDTNYENNLTAHYKMGNWTPWLEFGDVSINELSSTRELRSRVGIRYSF
ncbi:N-acetylneuraminic acid outer membrane channel protein NanC [Psychromonas sp. psych-6C06]|uniref:oligogalacturonate-specific porin KdgM family protein n=1 Tax=Psychromonas sp. psych-6C06 TaxID=2058089 RepID=UPI000C331FF9|nr:oligogalacturonate-specific porin KdgM family protein [Psychromonas sp. psych-6C06]PKF60568.1 N-acetylneuraminic acid outer membrane channel protein NanC [Psychromonas sp. psych-6C06]